MKRNCQNENEIRWFDLPAHMVFHYSNAWEEKADNGDDVIRGYGCVNDGQEFNLDLN
jgi:carotenoid cleavage dioxygenase-like enzyme